MFALFYFIEKQTTIIEIMKKRIKENMATAWDGPLLRLLHVIKMLRTKREKTFLLVCATFYVLNVNNNIAFPYLHSLM